MKRVFLFAVMIAALLGSVLYTTAFGACTCTVTGILTLDPSCHATTLNLWVQDYEDPIDPDPNELIWTLKMSLEGVGSGETFIFYPVECHFSCSARFQIKSKGNVLYDGYLPGVGGSLDVGTIHDPSRCSKIKLISELPPPPN
jgi:hypothetical protein